MIKPLIILAALTLFPAIVGAGDCNIAPSGAISGECGSKDIQDWIDKGYDPRRLHYDRITDLEKRISELEKRVAECEE